MILIINKNWRIIAEESAHEFFLLPYLHLMLFLGVELSVGWLQFSVTLSYSSDDDNRVIDEIKKGGSDE